MPRSRSKQPVQAAATGTYGQAAELERSQNVVALPNSQVQPRPVPGAAGQFARPSEAPDEPITAGAPFGPGQGAAQQPAVNEVDFLLRALYQKRPTPGLRRLIEGR